MNKPLALADIKALSAHDLAAMVDSFVDNTQAIAFFGDLRDAVVDVLPDPDSYDEHGQLDDGIRASLMYDAPSFWNATVIQQAIGTRQHLVSADLGTLEMTMVELAGYVMYELAGQLVDRIVERYLAFDEEPEAPAALEGSEPTA